MNTDLKSLIENNPDLQEIVHRLENSKKETEEKNSKLPEGTDQKKISIPEHCRITDWKMHRDIGFTQAICEPQAGKEGLEKQLAFIIKLRNPDCIKIAVYKGKGQRAAMPVLSREINLRPAPQELNGVSELREEIEELKKNIGNNSNDSELKRQYDALLKKVEQQEWNGKIDNLKRTHEKEIEILNKRIEEKEKEVEGLKEEIEDTEKGLEGVQEKLKTAVDPPFVTMLGKIAEKALEGAAIRNPEFLEKICKLDKDTIQQMLDEINKREKQTEEKGEEKEDSSGFSEAADEFEGLEEKHKTAIKELIGVFKQISFPVFGKLYLIFSNLQNAEGEIDEERAAKVLEYIKSLNTN